MLVKFNDLDEFLAEMEKDKSEIARGIVRVTTLREKSKSPSFPFFFYSVIATYRRGDEIVRLDRFCGNYWPKVESKSNKETEENIQGIYEALDRKIKERGLEMRAGVYSVNSEEERWAT